jgi:hypothetical protein
MYARTAPALAAVAVQMTLQGRSCVYSSFGSMPTRTAHTARAPLDGVFLERH